MLGECTTNEVGGGAGSRTRVLARPTKRERFLVRVRERIVVINTADIDWIEAADYYASIHAAGHSYLLRDRESLARARDRTALSRRFDARVDGWFAREAEQSAEEEFERVFGGVRS